MLEVYKPNIFIGDGLKTKFGIRLADKGIFGAFFMGSVFALAFCPYSAVMFFGLLIPLSIQSDITGMSFPIIFGIGTGLPVLLFAILLGISSAFARVYVKKLSRIEPYIRKPIGAIFMIYVAYMLIIFISRVFFLRP
jgi:cytochrome c biogenesis protein CcdA